MWHEFFSTLLSERQEDFFCQKTFFEVSDTCDQNRWTNFPLEIKSLLSDPLNNEQMAITH